MMPIAAMSMTVKNTGKWHRTFKGEWLNNPSYGSLTEPATEEDCDIGVHWKLSWAKVKSHSKATYPALSKEGFVQNIQVKWCFHRGFAKTEGWWGGWTQVGLEQPAAQGPLQQNTLVGRGSSLVGEPRLRKAVMQRGMAHLGDESSLFTIPHQSGKALLHMWSRVVGHSLCSPSWPQICSNSLASAAQVLRLQVWVIMPRLNKLQIKKSIFWTIIL